MPHLTFVTINYGRAPLGAPPHVTLTQPSQNQSHFTADSQSVCLGVEPTLWTFDQILLPFHHTNLLNVFIQIANNKGI
jgi:hypothetical protein